VKFFCTFFFLKIFYFFDFNFFFYFFCFLPYFLFFKKIVWFNYLNQICSFWFYVWKFKKRVGMSCGDVFPTVWCCGFFYPVTEISGGGVFSVAVFPF